MVVRRLKYWKFAWVNGRTAFLRNDESAVRRSWRSEPVHCWRTTSGTCLQGTRSLNLLEVRYSELESLALWTFEWTACCEFLFVVTSVWPVLWGSHAWALWCSLSILLYNYHTSYITPQKGKQISPQDCRNTSNRWQYKERPHQKLVALLEAVHN